MNKLSLLLAATSIISAVHAQEAHIVSNHLVEEALRFGTFVCPIKGNPDGNPEYNAEKCQEVKRFLAAAFAVNRATILSGEGELRDVSRIYNDSTDTFKKIHNSKDRMVALLHEVLETAECQRLENAVRHAPRTDETLFVRGNDSRETTTTTTITATTPFRITVDRK